MAQLNIVTATMPPVEKIMDHQIGERKTILLTYSRIGVKVKFTFDIDTGISLVSKNTFNQLKKIRKFLLQKPGILANNFQGQYISHLMFFSIQLSFNNKIANLDDGGHTIILYIFFAYLPAGLPRLRANVLYDTVDEHPTNQSSPKYLEEYLCCPLLI